jgi:hypothetical protein
MANNVYSTTAGNYVLGNINSSSWWDYSTNGTSTQKSHPFQIKNNNGNLMVHLNERNELIWNKDYKIDDVAERLSKAIIMSSELAANINYDTKKTIRNTIFEELIEESELNGGTLSTEELTNMLKGAIIMDKLKGI